MNGITDQELVEIGRSAAASVADLGKVDVVEATGGQDSSQAFTYVFSFLVNQEQGRTSSLSGLAYISLAQAIRDGLMARGDDHYPILHLFGVEDWEKRRRA